MKPDLRLRGCLALALLAAGVPAFASRALATELGFAAHAAGFRIHSADETLTQYCAWVDGKLWFTIPGGASWELVTETGDPAISNPGDGAFHPFDVSEVESARDGVRYPLQRIAAEVFILPYPRRLGLDSAAGPGLILLSPGVRPISSDQQCAEFVHELGHVVQYTLMPDADTGNWDRYRALRGIEDVTLYCSSAPHADRPHEIFAEDFRALFGPQAANTAGTIENDALVYPTQIAGLSAFVQDLASLSVRPGVLAVLGDGARGAVRLARTGNGPAVLDLFDVSGRRLASVAPEADASGATWLWSGRDAAGREVRGAVVFARARDGRGGSARIIRLP
jgi:hypothetical protein